MPIAPDPNASDLTLMAKSWGLFSSYPLTVYSSLFYFLCLRACVHACVCVCVCVCVCALCAQSCPTICDQLGCSPLGSSLSGIFQARILQWVSISFSRGSSQPRDQTHVSCVSCIGRQILYQCTIWEASTFCTDNK